MITVPGHLNMLQYISISWTSHWDREVTQSAITFIKLLGLGWFRERIGVVDPRKGVGTGEEGWARRWLARVEWFRSRGCIVPSIVCPIVWHHGPITADKTAAMLSLCVRVGAAVCVFGHGQRRPREKEGKKRQIRKKYNVGRGYRSSSPRGGKGWLMEVEWLCGVLAPLFFWFLVPLPRIEIACRC